MNRNVLALLNGFTFKKKKKKKKKKRKSPKRIENKIVGRVCSLREEDEGS